MIRCRIQRELLWCLEMTVLLHLDLWAKVKCRNDSLIMAYSYKSTKYKNLMIFQDH